MPYSLCFGIEAETRSEVADALRSVTGAAGETHESLYLGDYDLFRIPEVVHVKFNFVDSDGEWDYPQHKDKGVLLVVDETDRPDYIVELIASLGFPVVLIADTVR